MASYRWSGKRVREFLEELSNNQKNFKTKPSGRMVKSATGDEESPNGFFRIVGAYGGWQLVYQLPYSTGNVVVSRGGFVSPGKLADYLKALGPDGLKMRFRDLQKHWKPIGKEQLEYEKARAQRRG